MLNALTGSVVSGRAIYKTFTSAIKFTKMIN